MKSMQSVCFVTSSTTNHPWSIFQAPLMLKNPLKNPHVTDCIAIARKIMEQTQL